MSAAAEVLARLPVTALDGGLRVHDARGPLARARGLMGAAALPAGSALRLSPCRSVHTFGMRFAIDLVWLDRRGAVTRVDRGVGARRARSCARARSVLETNAGEGQAFAAALQRSGYTFAR